MSKLKIVHIEDNEADAHLVSRALKKAGMECEIKVVETEKEFISALHEFKPDAILSDHSLPQFNSMEALRIYLEEEYDAPFILVTGSVSEEFATTCLKKGAADYILKSSLIRLPSAIDQAIKARRTESEKRKADRELDLINQELNMFIYKAAHDLRGPLCTIMGLVNVAGYQDNKDNLTDCIHKISRSTHQLDVVLQDLMEVMSLKDIKPALREVDFEKFLPQVLKAIEPMEGFGAVSVELAISSPKGIFSDEALLSKVLHHILENAVHYRNKTQFRPCIRISTAFLNDELIIQVQDNGIGMDKEIQAHIFEMYYRGNKLSKGSGLGLYIAYKAVKKLGGRIEVNSEPMKGSEFTITIPASVLLMQ